MSGAPTEQLSAREQRRRAQGLRSIVIVVSERVHSYYFGRPDGSTGQMNMSAVLEREVPAGWNGRHKERKAAACGQQQRAGTRTSTHSSSTNTNGNGNGGE